MEDEILELFNKIPSYGISKRFYSGEDLNYEDRFQVLKDRRTCISSSFMKTDTSMRNPKTNSMPYSYGKTVKRSIYIIDTVYEQVVGEHILQ